MNAVAVDGMQLARLFLYPDESYPMSVTEAAGGWAPLGAMQEAIAGLSLERLQELFVQTFDLSPDCALEIGWHLFGENYERGEFLVDVRDRLKRYDVAETAGLPDHIAHILQLLERMPGSEARSFATTCVSLALRRMRDGLRDKSNPFGLLLAATAAWVDSRFQEGPGES